MVENGAAKLGERARTGPTDDDSAAVSEETRKAKLFMHGRSQAVGCPRNSAFRERGPGAAHGDGVLLEPMEFDVDAWLCALDIYRDIPFMDDGRSSLKCRTDDINFDE
jgi:virulence-associated protein VagC